MSKKPSKITLALYEKKMKKDWIAVVLSLLILGAGLAYCKKWSFMFLSWGVGIALSLMFKSIAISVLFQLGVAFYSHTYCKEYNEILSLEMGIEPKE